MAFVTARLFLDYCIYFLQALVKFSRHKPSQGLYIDTNLSGLMWCQMREKMYDDAVCFDYVIRQSVLCQRMIKVP